MKKLLALATAAFCVLSLGACATNNGGTSAPASGGYTFADTVKWMRNMTSSSPASERPEP